MELNDKLKQTLIKKATGFKVEESVCEYVVQEDEVKLLKKKVSTKYFPPDLSAISMLLNTKETNLKNLSDLELEQEKERILELLKEIESGN